MGQGRNCHQLSASALPAYARGALLAAAVFALGVLVYMLDRRAGSAVGLPAFLFLGPGNSSAAVAGSAPSVFGALGGNLPSFAHAFAFSLLSCLVLPPRLPWMASACAFWALVDAGFEILQQPMLAQAAAAALRRVQPPWPGLELVAAYFVNGRYDPLDLLASSLGAVAAFAVAAFVICRRRKPT